MTTTTQSSYAPRTRIGLLISCLGFAALAATAVLPTLDAAVSPLMGIGFVAAVVVIVYVPRLIPPAPTWFRAALSRTFATGVFFVAGAAALLAVTIRASTGALIGSYVALAVILVGILCVAIVTPGRPVKDRVRRTPQ